MISDNKINRYVFYATGEFFLVAICILNALQLPACEVTVEQAGVNIWNEERRERSKEQTYLYKLSINLKEDILLLNDIIKDDSLIFEQLKFLSEPILIAESINEVEFSNDARFKAIQFYPKKTSFNNIFSSGQIDIIQNKEIIERLETYYRTIDIYNESIDFSLKNYSRDIEHFFIGFDHITDHPSLSKTSIEEYRNDPFILNSFFFKNGLLIRQRKIIKSCWMMHK